MSDKTIQSLLITKSQTKKLRRIAADLGYTIGRGREKDWGSITQLNKAIAEGDIILIKANSGNKQS